MTTNLHVGISRTQTFIDQVIKVEDKHLNKIMHLFTLIQHRLYMYIDSTAKYFCPNNIVVIIIFVHSPLCI